MAKQNSRKGKYSGVLATPREFHFHSPEGFFPLSPPSEEKLEKWKREDAEKNWAQYFERLNALFEHYDVTFGNFPALAMELAYEHVPGFRYRAPGERRRGRPPSVSTWEKSLERGEQFYEILRLADKKGIKRACELASKRKESCCYGIAPATLRKMVAEAKRAPEGDLNGMMLRVAQGIIDRGVTIPLWKPDADAHPSTKPELQRDVRKK